MKHLRFYAISILLVLIIFSSLFSDEKSKVYVEPWEKKWNNLQPPEVIMDTIGLKEGMTIGDIGAGKGRFTVWFAERVGDSGKVYANDISLKALNHLEQRCKDHNIKNIVTILGKVEDPCFEEISLDIAFMVNVYHHLDKPVELLKNIIPDLRPDGILAIVEHDPVKAGFSAHESTPKQKMIEELNKAGFELTRIESFLEKDYIYICKPKMKH